MTFIEDHNEEEEFIELDEFCEDEALEEDDFDVFEEKSPLEQWKQYKKEGGFYDYGQWLEENGYMKVEQWAPIPEFEGYFEASDMGRIKNTWTGKVLKQGINSKGYKTVTVNILGQAYTRSVHRLIASAFIEDDLTGLEIHHKDTNKTNNRLSNLECCTRKEHVERSIEDGISNHHNFGRKRIKVKCMENGKKYNSLNECERDIGVHVSEIRRYLAGEVKTTCKGYTFERVE